MKKTIRNILTAVSLSAVLCASGCTGDPAPETSTAAPSPETTVAVDTSKEAATVDYSKAVRTVEVPYGDGEDSVAIFAFNANGDLVKKEHLPWGGDNTYYTYDENGRLIETQETDWDGVIDDGSLPGNENQKYFYDENDNVIRIDVYRPEYDGLAEYYTFKYDENGNKTYEALRYGSNNELQYEETYEYDENGKLIGSQEACENCEYDENGNLVKEIVDGITVTYEYQNGLLMCQKNDGIISVEYKYFDNNNIVVRQWYESDGTPNEINIDLYSDLFEN